MPEITETTQDPVVTTPDPQVPPQQEEEQGAVGAQSTPAPSKTNTEETKGDSSPKKPSQEEIQRRIDRMYARLQEERKQRIFAEQQLQTKKDVSGDSDEEPETTPAKQITEADIDAALDRRERSKKVLDSESQVFARHPSALNDDGTFNMSDPFVVKYMEIARQNPTLGTMDNGPELAEAMADKMLGADYRKGRVDEAKRVGLVNNSFTTTSTTTPTPSNNATQLTPGEQKVARRMGLTDKAYADSKTNKIPQKSWETKVR